MVPATDDADILVAGLSRWGQQFLAHDRWMTDSTSTQQLRELVADRVRAVATRDTQHLAQAQAPDILVYNVVGPLALRGASQVAEQANAWFDAYAEGPDYEIQDLQVDADEDLGYCAFVYHVAGTLRSGEEVDMRVRATLVCRRIDDRWRIVHDHESVPWTGPSAPTDTNSRR